MCLFYQDIYTLLTEKYNYPIWAVLTLFVVITILLGLLLGIVFILIIDCICPPKHNTIEEMTKIPVIYFLILVYFNSFLNLIYKKNLTFQG